METNMESRADLLRDRDTYTDITIEIQEKIDDLESCTELTEYEGKVLERLKVELEDYQNELDIIHELLYEAM